MPIYYQVAGVPVPWAAPLRNKGRYYDPKSLEKEKIIWQLRSQFNHECITGAILLNVIFYMPIPKNTSKVRKLQMLNGVIHHRGKPDRTNLLKLIEDCIERAGIISNDSIIVGGHSEKLYGLVPRTFIEIEVLENEGQKHGHN